MGERIVVDGAKLREGAKHVSDAAKNVEHAAGAGTAGAVAAVEDALPDAVTNGPIVEIGRQIAEVAADLTAAMQGLSQGLEQAATNFHEVDVVYAKAAGTP